MVKRLSVSAGVAALLCCLALFAAWRTRVLERSELRVLSAKVGAVAAAWDANRVPSSSRMICIVISDAGSGPEPLASPEEPGLPGRTAAWVRRTFLRPAAGLTQHTAFGQVFADAPNAVIWTHQGFSAASEAMMMREVAASIVLAHDAGAEINIVAQGPSAASVLKALRLSEGMVRGGVQVGANKVVVVGMDAARLARVDPAQFAQFKKPANVLELAFLWTRDSLPSGKAVRLFTRSREGTEQNAGDLWPALGASGGTPADTARVVKDLVFRIEPLESSLGRIAQAAAPAQDTASGTASVPGPEGSGPISIPAPAPAGQAQDSLSLLRVGEPKPEPERPAAPAKAEEAVVSDSLKDFEGSWVPIQTGDDNYYLALTVDGNKIAGIISADEAGVCSGLVLGQDGMLSGGCDFPDDDIKNEQVKFELLSGKKKIRVVRQAESGPESSEVYRKIVSGSLRDFAGLWVRKIEGGPMLQRGADNKTTIVVAPEGTFQFRLKVVGNKMTADFNGGDTCQLVLGEEGALSGQACAPFSDAPSMPIEIKLVNDKKELRLFAVPVGENPSVRDFKKVDGTSGGFGLQAGEAARPAVPVKTEEAVVSGSLQDFEGKWEDIDENDVTMILKGAGNGMTAEVSSYDNDPAGPMKSSFQVLLGKNGALSGTVMLNDTIFLAFGMSGTVEIKLLTGKKSVVMSGSKLRRAKIFKKIR